MRVALATLAVVCIIATIVLIGFCVKVVWRDFGKARDADRKLEERVEAYANMERVGLKDGYWVYIVTDKAGNQTLCWKGHTVPLKK